MVVLALVLLIVVVVFSVAIVLGNPSVYDLSVFRVLIPVTSAGVFFTGVGAALLTAVAVLLLRLGIRRGREQRQRLKAAEQASIGSGSPNATGSPAASDQPNAAELAADSDTSESADPTSGLDVDQPATTTPAERQAMPDETDDLSRDEPKR